MTKTANSTLNVNIPDAPDLSDALNKLTRVQSLNELLFLAGEGLLSMDRNIAEAITTGCDVIDEMLQEIKSILNVIQKGGEA